MLYLDALILNLIEKACRRIQRLTGRTNVWLALQLTNLSVIVYFVWAGAYFLSAGVALRIFIGIICTGVLYVLVQTVFKEPIEAYENNAFRRMSKGVINPRRVRDALLRVSFLTLSIVLPYPVFYVYFDAHVQIPLLTYSLIVLTTGILYLLACDPLPPSAAKLKARASDAVPSRVPAPES
jgi:hypothetical protein